MKLEFTNRELPEVKDFVHLHLHTIYSVLDGVCKLEPLVERAKEFGMTAVAQTDHNHIGGALAFQKACKKGGIKPILGLEGYMTHDMKIAALSPEERLTLALTQMFQNETEVNTAIAEKKKDCKPYSFYQEKLQEAFHKRINDDNKPWSTKNITIEDIKKVFTVKQLTSLKKLNSKLLEKYEYDMHQYHIIFLAMNQTGWNNLIKLQSEAADKCTYNGRFLMDFDLIKKYNEGLICTTACIGSLFSKLIQQKKLEEAEKLILKFKEIFQDRFYLEIQPLTLPAQYVTNEFFLSMYKKYNIEPVATSDVHYLLKEDHDDHDTFMCIAMGRLKDEAIDKEVYIKAHKNDPLGKKFKPRMKYTNDYWFRSKEEMVEGFIQQEADSIAIYKEENPLKTKEYRDFWLRAIENTRTIAATISEDIQIGSTVPLYPKVNNVPKGMSHDDYLMAEAIRGLIAYSKKRKAEGRPIDYQKYLTKILDEMKVITSKHYTDYFLGVQEYTNWANSINPETNLPYAVSGPGRGSAASSLVLFLIGITKNVDPIEHDLMFSRFLTMDRKSPPDIDLDYNYTNRCFVIKHLEEEYGKEKVCHIGTWTVESMFSGIKDFARVLNYPPSFSDALNKELQAICNDPGISFKTFDEFKENEPEKYEQFQAIENKPENKEIFRLARKFEGTIRQFGIHASGVLCCPEAVNNFVPTRKDKDSGVTVSLFTGTELEEINCIKYDILGLKTLSIIENTLVSISKTFEDLYDEAGLYDKETFEMIARGETDGVFQIESNMMKGLCKDIEPSNIDDLSALVAIGRPGPLGMGTDKQYAAWKKDAGLREEYLPNIQDILARSYGTLIYQEQCMQLSIRVCGFNQGQSDSLMRKIIGKKKVELLDMLGRIMVYGMKTGKGPDGWKDNLESPWYDEEGKYGDPIPGAIALGYDKNQVQEFYEKMKAFARYGFNLSHSLCYAYIGYLTAYLKCHYPSEYMAAVLSMQDKPEKLEKYIQVCENTGIKLTVPDINHSKESFTAVNKNTISYGLSAIKGVKSVSEIIANAPYASVKDAFEKLPAASFNKRVAEALIKAGAFDFENTNRYALLNELYKLRNKKEELLDESLYNKEKCMEFETELLGMSLTYIPAWKNAIAGEPLQGICTFKNIKHHIIKSGKNQGKCMAMLTVINESYNKEALVFHKEYPKLKNYLKENKKYFVKGCMDNEGKKLIINSISENLSDLQSNQNVNTVFDFNMFEYDFNVA